MAVVKSNVVTNADDLDTQNEQGQIGKPTKAIAEYTAAGVIADDDVILLNEIPVDAKITSVKLWSDDLGTTGDFNVGFYPGPGSQVTIASDSDAVDEDAIASAVDVNAAAVANSELRFEAANITTASDTAWELAGLSARPDYGTFYLAITASEATTAGGDILVISEWLQ